MNATHAIGRRAALGRIAAGSVVAFFGAGSRARVAGADPAGDRELLVDPSFQRGFRLCEPTPGKRVPYGELRGFEPGAPAWDLDQWSSRIRLEPDLTANSPGIRRWENGAKSVVLGHRIPSLPAADVADVALGVKASVEYAGHARKADQPWVHLLLEQAIAGAPSIAELRRARFRIEARLQSSKLHRTDDYSPDRHAAQFQVFLALQNTRETSPGKGRLVWFGIPLYDDRHRVPPEHKTRDTGGTDMFIFTPRGDVYAPKSAHDGDWIAVDHDLVPLLRESLTEAWSKGFLMESRNLADYRITSINLGWEVPGIFDVAMQVRGLSLTVAMG